MIKVKRALISVSDKTGLVDFAKGLPQKVNTITLFAASMGFEIAQALDTRYITSSGILMAHRTSLGGLEGQVNGEFESRYKMVRNSTDYMHNRSAQRMGINLDTYEKKIANELWVHGFEAEKERVADEEVNIRCGTSLKGSYTEVYETSFGTAEVTFPKCPLIRTPDNVKMVGVDVSQDESRSSAVLSSIYNPLKFLREYIITNRFHEIFP